MAIAVVRIRAESPATSDISTGRPGHGRQVRYSLELRCVLTQVSG